jgi:peptidoglycan hydrolase-like protein with peptidoglycan-binding domain
MLPRRRPHLSLALFGALTLVLGVTGALQAASSTPRPTIATTAAATNPVTPGDFTGLGFDQCNAPTQQAMDAWRAKSPFRAVGIYISGNSRFCREQPNLTPTWVRTQLANGWHLLPITLGPQASCQFRFPRYGWKIDPRINPSATSTYAAARAQARAEARTAVAAAKALGIVPGSTLFYDLEGFSLTHSTGCTQSALWFMSAWSNELHRLGYVSGVYSSASSGITLLERTRLKPVPGVILPDQLWIAHWHTGANTRSSYVAADGWANHQRVKQYQGGHKETWGGVTINIDRNYLDLRTPAVPRPVGGPPAPPAAPPAAPPTTPVPPTSPAKPASSLADAKCTRSSINRPEYRRTGSVRNRALLVPLQCLLKQQHLYTGAVTGRWSTKTRTALRAFQRRVHHPQRSCASRSDWVALLSAGSRGTTLRTGARSTDVIMAQRALNAATSARLRITGTYDARTRATVLAYQHRFFRHPNGEVGPKTWRALHQGRW